MKEEERGQRRGEEERTEERRRKEETHRAIQSMGDKNYHNTTEVA